MALYANSIVTNNLITNRLLIGRVGFFGAVIRTLTNGPHQYGFHCLSVENKKYLPSILFDTLQ